MLNDKYNYKKYLIKINKDSLSVYKYPELYAQLKNNIGNAYYELSKHENKEENLKEAIKAFDDALTVRQREISAIGYARQNLNLGYAYKSLSDSVKALKYTKEALSTYQTLKYTRKIEEAERLLEDLN
jgi:tetratricopeptide (TPR) repeat protein